MTEAIKLFVKSEKQYNRTRESLDALGLRGFLLGGYRKVDNFGITVFFSSNSKYTDGCMSAESFPASHVFTTYKEFIAAVQKYLV